MNDEVFREIDISGYPGALGHFPDPFHEKYFQPWWSTPMIEATQASNWVDEPAQGSGVGAVSPAPLETAQLGFLAAGDTESTVGMVDPLFPGDSPGQASVHAPSPTVKTNLPTTYDTSMDAPSPRLPNDERMEGSSSMPCDTGEITFEASGSSASTSAHSSSSAESTQASPVAASESTKKPRRKQKVKPPQPPRDIFILVNRQKKRNGPKTKQQLAAAEMCKDVKVCTIHGTPEYHCPKCGTVKTTTTHLRIHAQTHFPELRSECIKCGKRFSAYQHYKRHLNTPTACKGAAKVGTS